MEDVASTSAGLPSPSLVEQMVKSYQSESAPMKVGDVRYLVNKRCALRLLAQPERREHSRRLLTVTRESGLAVRRLRLQALKARAWHWQAG